MPIELFALLLSPLAGGAVLALIGHRPRAAEVNAAFSSLTFAAAAVLVARVIERGQLVALGEQLFVDSINVFLVGVTVFDASKTSFCWLAFLQLECEDWWCIDAITRLSITT